METEIYIKSELFPAYPGEEEEINPGRFGKRLAEFIKELLIKENIEVADLYSTDYSYELRLDQFKFSVYISTGNIDEEKNEFLISISPKKEFKRKLFKKIPTKETVTKIYNVIKKGILNNPEIQIMEI
ncbi:hypothetical protein [Seonamhaeicola marinus]|uniref:Uncharacterized protein n=1 Tax=Seonamhaeicola marinus TaxID=1912246 RepID=A0A5D0ILM0_9FLAO|nr:hypothetical protein [Seonamhaeicola marinus]TYA84424.1 hypothetical protein FUA24_07205 [Seonamhaeicola marinus]